MKINTLYIVIALIAFVLPFQSFAQKSNSALVLDRETLAFSAGSIFFTDNTAFNQFLNSNGFPNLPGNMLFLYGISSETQVKKLVFKASYLASYEDREKQKAAEYTPILKYYGSRFLIGYDIKLSKSLSLIPSLGYEYSRARLKLYYPADTTGFAPFSASPNVLMSYTNFHGIAAEISLLIYPLKNNSYDLTIGYRHSFPSGTWNYMDEKFSDGPVLNLSGIYVQFSWYFNINAFKKALEAGAGK